MRAAVYIAAAVLAILHQDFWYWDDPTLVLGFLPVGLAYHVVYTLAAALLWGAAIRYAWPAHLERLAESGAQPGSKGDPAA